MEQGEKLCNKVETARELTYLHDRVSAGKCETVPTARTKCGLNMFRECSELLC